ncbi:TlpA disulfide reductase family protein [Flavobacterium tegetincola]|uniref:TlpA disulfide reductase family protein n=1 Tax=Flavobacterium tegetincola TaxID=150172 RepID=UPI00040A686E|nr:TlpA disulfide reductase family protein [Flavobacterium tegetincola]
MNRIFIISTIALGLISFTNPIKSNFSVSGTATGVQDGTMVYLERQEDGKGMIAVDSAKIAKGVFTIKGMAVEPAVNFIQVKGIEGKIAFILDQGAINMTIYKDSIAKSKIGGTPDNDALQKFNLFTQVVQQKMQNFQTLNAEKMQTAQKNEDQATIQQLMDEFGLMQNELLAYTSTYPQNNPTSFLSVLLLDNMFNQPEVDIQKIKTVYGSLTAKLQKTKPGLSIKNKIDNYKDISVGNVAPDFSGPTPDGKTLSLKQAMGKLTIIDFWASWCGPCRKENPSVVALYNEFHEKGLNIIGVSLDKDGAKWKEAIAKDGLTWSHVSNLQFWTDPIAVLYNIKSIPATYIIDEKGVIIATNLRGDELRAKIASLLSK